MLSVHTLYCQVHSHGQCQSHQELTTAMPRQKHGPQETQFQAPELLRNISLCAARFHVIALN